MKTAKQMAKEYRELYGLSLYGRLRILSHRYPNIEEDSFISWEGDRITGADTSEKISTLMHQLTWTD